MFEWLTDAVNTVIDFFTGDSGDDGTEPDPCDVRDCLSALAELDAARGSIQSACFWLGLVLAPLRVALFIVSRTLVEYLIALIILIMIFGLMGIFIAAAIIGLSLLFIYAWIPVITAVGQTLATAFQAEVNAILRVQTECPAECQGDLTPSECDVGDGNILPEGPIGGIPGLDDLLGLLDRLNDLTRRR